MNKILNFLIVVLLVSCSNPPQQNDTTLLLEKLTPQIDSLMQEHKLSGLSVAVIDDSKILWHKEYGFKENGIKEKINENTAYSTASISKAITATTCLILEEEGKIDIDSPIREYLKKWQLPNSDYLQKTDVTIRHLLSHTSGTSHGGYADFYGNDSIPTLVQCLNGELLPRTNEPIAFLFEPGTDVLYSGGGYVIVQLALEDVLNKPFQDIVAETIFKPLQMAHSTMIQPNQKGFLTNVAKVHNINQEVIRTGLPICPQLGPSGTWSTAKDLALFALETQNALNGKTTKVISPKVAKELSDIITYKYVGGGALGWQRSYAFGNIEWLTIMGQNTGVGGEVNLSMEGGKGIVMLANGESKNRLPILNFVRSQIIDKLNWYREIDGTDIPLDDFFIKNVQGSYIDFMYCDFSEIVTISESEGQLYISSQLLKILTGSEKNRLYHQGDYVFKVDGYPNIISFQQEQNSTKAISIYRTSNEENKLTIPMEELKTMKVKVLDAFSSLDFSTCKERYEALKKEESGHDFSNSLLTVGITFYSRNEIDKTLQIFEFNAQENPDNPNSYLALAEINERIGNTKETIKYYEKALMLIENSTDKKALKDKIESLKQHKST